MESQASSVSVYPDADAVNGRLQALLRQPIRRLKPEALKQSLNYFEARCSRSKAMITRAAESIPGGIQHNLAFNYPHPLVFTEARGAELVDLDGNRYIDFLQAGGPTVLGSNPESVRRQVIEVLNTTGPVTGLFHEFEMKLAEKIVALMPGVDFFRMLGSGTEAAMASIRVARLATGHKNVVKMGGAYHGWSDQLAYGIRIPGTRHLESHGIPRNCFKHTQEFFPGDLQALERVLRLNRLRGGTAAVLLEPIGPESGTRPVARDFAAGVRRLCDRYGALLIFDEVVTAFRIGMSGAQGFFGVTPDLTILGKVVAGGYPSAGGLGGLEKHKKYLAAGLESGAKRALVGGTMAANPLSSAAGYFTLCEMERTGACGKAGAAADRLIAGLTAIFQRLSLPFVAYNQGAVCHLQTAAPMLLAVSWSRPWRIPGVIREARERKDVMEEMGAAYMAEGLVTLAGSRLYTSAAQDESLIDEALARFERIFKNIEGAGDGD